MIRQENCPYCDWKIDWAQVKTDGDTKTCPHCDTRLMGEMKRCSECGELSPVDAFYCLHCGTDYPEETVSRVLELMEQV